MIDRRFYTGKGKYISPKSREFPEYYWRLDSYNRKVQSDIAGVLSDEFGVTRKNFAIAVIGSDSRFEKGPTSPVELVIFYDPSVDIAEVTRRTADCTAKNGVHMVNSMIDLKDVQNGVMSEYPFETPSGIVNVVSPNITFDSALLYGNPDIIKRAHAKLGEELLGPNGARIYEEIKQKAKNFRKIMATGIEKRRGKDMIHYDLEKAVANYDEQNHLLSFKPGPLRAVQFSVVRSMLRYIRSGGNPEVVFSLPHNTVARLSVMNSEGLTHLNSDELSHLKENYMYFLWLYHTSQEASSQGESQIPFDRKEVTRRCAEIDTLCSKFSEQ